jgi:hypothetical protein
MRGRRVVNALIGRFPLNSSVFTSIVAANRPLRGIASELVLRGTELFLFSDTFTSATKNNRAASRADQK